jgi:hypothetical protein
MKVKMLLIAAALLACASLSFAQNYDCVIDTWVPLTGTCLNGGPDTLATPLPDGTIVKIYQILAGTTPGAHDPQPAVGTTAGMMVYNEFPIDGAAILGMPGCFSVPFQSIASPVPGQNLFYLRIVTPTDSLISGTFSGGQQIEPDLTYTWRCFPLVVPCVPTRTVHFTPTAPHGDQNPVQYQCIDLCPGSVCVVTVGPLLQSDRIPHIFVAEGCVPPGCDRVCDPAHNIVLGEGHMTGDAGQMEWTLNIALDGVIGTRGCACVRFDFIEPVNISAFDVVPYDASANIAWTTASENGMDHFEIVRDGEVVKTLAATNTASAHNYTYTDANLTNGRTYKYELYSVSVNNARELQKTASVSPNADAALVTEYALHQNYPNPFNPNTKIAFDLVSNNVVTLTIYNATGQEVATVLNGAQYTSGRHSVNFDAANLPSGLYFYTVKIGSEFSATKKMLLLK